MLLQTWNRKKSDGKPSRLVPQTQDYANLLQIVSLRVPREDVVFTDFSKRFHQVVFRVVMNMDLFKKWMVILLYKVIVCCLHLSMAQNVFHEKRLILIQNSLASRLKNLQKVVVKGVIKHLVFKVNILLFLIVHNSWLLGMTAKHYSSSSAPSIITRLHLIKELVLNF